ICGVVWRATYVARQRLPFLLYALAVIGILSILVFEVYIGVFSAVAVVLVLGVSYFGMGQARRSILWLAGGAIALYVALAASVILGVMSDPGIFAPAAAPPMTQVGLTVVVTTTLLATLWQARASRRATERAIERAARAAREARDREARMVEAEQQLDRVVRGAAGKTGRYTDTVLDGWKLGGVIGRGAMGEVYEARHVARDAEAAVKLLHFTQDDRVVRRFFREMAIASKLSGPHLVRIFGVGTTPDSVPFIAMERLHGRHLAAVLRSDVRMTLDALSSLVTQVARGLAAAHAQGVVHRDVKPQNLFLADRPGAQPEWIVLDFGIAQVPESSGTLTEGHLIGTPSYMSPEQAMGRTSDHRADVFALGAVAYRASTGRVPFGGQAAPQILHAVVYDPPVRPRDINPELPHDVERVLAIALAKRPDDRFQSTTDLADAMRRAISRDLSPALRTRAQALTDATPWQRAP
ncbi:MAG TPA: serine/threonine-protein kinase, partial [Polyangiaceae bacterium]